MKSLFRFRFLLLSIFFTLSVSAIAQEKVIKSFRGFIQLLQKSDSIVTPISDSVYKHFLNDTPFKDDESEKIFKILLIRNEYVGLLHNYSYDMGKEKESKLITYNWDGEIITEFDYLSVSPGDYPYDSLTCILKPNDKIECRNAIKEGGIEEVLDEDDKVIGNNYVSAKEKLIISYFEILSDGTIEEIESGEDQD
jgi:hypothetical protein